jgi:hypothetical protein
MPSHTTRRSHPNFFLLEKAPSRGDIHLWADYAELCCLSDPDRQFSKADLLGYIRKRRDFRMGFEDIGGEDSEDETVESEAPSDVRAATRAEDLFKHLEYRIGAFKEFYPFYVSHNGDILYRRKRLNAKQKLYIFFLLAANTRNISSKRHRNQFTNAFETACVVALKAYSPAAQVHLFGTNSLKEGRYKIALLIDRIKLLAGDIRDDFIGKADGYNNTGDNGLDIVAWIPFKDKARGQLLVFGQCACSYEEWADKQAASSFMHWGSTLRFMVPPSNVMFMPFCYRSNLGEWYKEDKIDQTILLDRLRLLKLLHIRHTKLKHLPHDLINEALKQSVPLG